MGPAVRNEFSYMFAFYCWEKDVKTIDSFNFIEEIASQLNKKLSTIELINYNTGHVSRPRYNTFSSMGGDHRFFDISSFSVYTSNSFFKKNGYTEFVGSFNQNIPQSDFSTISYFTFSVHRDFHSEKFDFTEIIKKIHKIFRPCYGFAKLADARSVAGPYVSGHSFDNAEDGFNAIQTAAVQHLSPVDLRSKIIDVFPVNYLSEGHLQQMIGGLSFRDWINRGNGLLEQTGIEHFWIWRVSDFKSPSKNNFNNDNRQYFREKLKNANLLIPTGLSWADQMALSFVDGAM